MNDGEKFKRAATAFIAWGSWLAVALVFLYATVNYNPNKGEFAPQWVGFTFIALIGVAIAAGNALGRHKLSDTMLKVYRAGVETARLQSEERKEMESRIMEASAQKSEQHAYRQTATEEE